LKIPLASIRSRIADFLWTLASDGISGVSIGTWNCCCITFAHTIGISIPYPALFRITNSWVRITIKFWDTFASDWIPHESKVTRWKIILTTAFAIVPLFVGIFNAFFVFFRIIVARNTITLD
jgi:hypothetical protein